MATVKTITTAATASSSSKAQTDVIQFNVTDESLPTLVEGEGDTDPVVNVLPGVNVIGFHANAIGEIHVKSISIEKMTSTGVIDVTDAKKMMNIAGGVLSIDGASEIAVYDILGRKVAESRGGESIDLNGKSAGVYVVNAVVNGSRISAKISK